MFYDFPVLNLGNTKLNAQMEKHEANFVFPCQRKATAVSEQDDLSRVAAVTTIRKDNK